MFCDADASRKSTMLPPAPPSALPAMKDCAADFLPLLPELFFLVLASPALFSSIPSSSSESARMSPIVLGLALTLNFSSSSAAAASLSFFFLTCDFLMFLSLLCIWMLLFGTRELTRSKPNFRTNFSSRYLVFKRRWRMQFSGIFNNDLTIPSTCWADLSTSLLVTKTCRKLREAPTTSLV